MKIGIIGGTFDPIHLGHLLIAEQAREELNLDRMIFIPVGNPVHKDILGVTGADIRYKMLELAIADNPRFYKSSIEVDRGGKTYTVDTIKELRKKYKEDRLYFLIGEDSLFNLNSWHKFHELKKLCEFIVCRRSLSDDRKIQDKIEYMNTKYDMKIQAINTPIIEISSTTIRDRLKSGKSIKYLVPKNVENYIIENNIYGDD